MWLLDLLIDTRERKCLKIKVEMLDFAYSSLHRAMHIVFVLVYTFVKDVSSASRSA